eukprot:1829380-Amphidinium_carterae.1
MVRAGQRSIRCNSELTSAKCCPNDLHPAWRSRLDVAIQLPSKATSVKDMASNQIKSLVPKLLS